MSKITIFSLALILFFMLASNTLADVSFTNDIELLDESINFMIVETYTGEDARSFKNDFDISRILLAPQLNHLVLPKTEDIGHGIVVGT